MYVVREFLVGDVQLTWKTVLSAFFACWLALFLSCTIGAIIRLRQQARGKRETAGRVSWSLETPPEEWHQGIRRGETYAQIHSTKDAVVRFCQVGIPTLLAWNLLPIAWYWRIGIILVLPFVIGLLSHCIVRVAARGKPRCGKIGPWAELETTGCRRR